MSDKSSSSSIKYQEMELRRGPWTLEEDSLLIHYIACHGEGRWNLLARSSGLKRTGKSCRLRWLNYLKPDIKRGNLSAEEQLLILELHSKWGNRWSRIAQYLPGRTDNEIKNYWRTRVQKQARQLRVDANSSVFRDAVRCYWMPRLLDEASASAAIAAAATPFLSQHPPDPQFLHDRQEFAQLPTENCHSQVLIPHMPQSSSNDQDQLARFDPPPMEAAAITTPDDVSFDPAFSNCSDIVSDMTNGGQSEWGMDELYGMLRGYMKY
ncbi:transcription factor MYB2-like [Zingiber officinale]|uniref:MYB protein n=1 Tax=Zingiber officinale TaxID=94328 RepID=A0A8J5KH06_ZINOF|nr:transcription factor MYB2-like [Zingiber officinale]KAG6480994.1 hypothetical protein ZIOFF_057585 [Zingiber officinale]WLQ69520.1 MYB protein [Zingiber officinale]